MFSMYEDLTAHAKRCQAGSALLRKLSVDFYQQELQSDNRALSYVMQERKVPEHIIQKFGVGYGSTASRFSSWLSVNAGESDLELFLQLGVLKPLHSEQVAHRFANRITFPVHDIDGNVVGFSSRKFAVSETEQKYLNSPSSWLYQKSLSLYGLFQARDSIQREGYAVVVEGMMDVLSLHSIGVTTAVAGGGTAFMLEHATILRCFTSTIKGWFDCDDAGRRANSKVEALCRDLDMHYVDVSLEGYKDADEAVLAGERERIYNSLV